MDKQSRKQGPILASAFSQVGTLTLFSLVFKKSVKQMAVYATPAATKPVGCSSVQNRTDQTRPNVIIKT